MASTYPTALDNFPTTRDDNTPMATNHAADHDNVNDAINKIEAELGINPSGSAATVADRLSVLEIVPFSIHGGNYTLVLNDLGKCVSYTGANPATITVPPESAVAFPLGSQIMVRRDPAAGAVTIAAGVGVTLQSRGSIFTLAGGGSWATLIKVYNDLWDLIGDLG